MTRLRQGYAGQAGPGVRGPEGEGGLRLDDYLPYRLSVASNAVSGLIARAYQDRFGHVFLICATGRTGEQMRDAVKERIGNSPEQEREIVRTELGKINRIRLARLVEEDA